jgi:Ca2+-binding RTX toxin-like protein
MNMISTGTFLNGMDASNKQSELVKKLVAAWEKKNSKVARAGGVSLMALSLAACGGDDTTPFAQSDIDAATAPLSAAVIVAEAALAAAQVDAAAALVAQSAAETQAATALVAQAAAEASAAAATVAGAANTVALAAATAAQATAEAALAVANTEKATLQASYDALVASNSTLQTSYDSVVAPKALALTSSSTADSLNGGVGNDVFTGALGTFAATDSVRDTSTTDSDTLTITHNAAIAQFEVTNVENVNLNLNALGAAAVDATLFTGIDVLTVTRGDVIVGGATLTGGTAVTVNDVDAADVAKIVIGAGTTAVDINAEAGLSASGKSGMVVDANTATTTVAYDLGAGTINADNAATSVKIDGAVYTTAAELAKPSVINAAKALTVSTDNGLTGSIDINAAAATTVTVGNAAGGLTVDTAAASATITVAGIDASGATINAGAGTLANNLEVDLTGSAATTTAVDTATVNASGLYVTIDTSKAADTPINVLNIGGNGAALTATIESTNSAASTYNKVGTQTVTLAGPVSEFTGATVTGVDVLDITSGSGAVAASLWTAGKVDLGYDAGAAVTVASGQTYEVTFDQTGLDYNFAAGSTAGNLTLVAGDDNGTSTSVGTIALGALDTNPGNTIAGTFTIEASIANVTSTGLTVGTLQNLVITGDEDVNLSATAIAAAGTASTISMDASASSGIITAKVGVDMPTVTTGSGADNITADNAATVHSVTTNAGNDTINITNTSDTSVFSGGDGTDTFNVDDVSNLVVVGGAGADTFNTNSALAGQVIGGDGTDTLVMDTDAATTFAGTFRMSSIEAINMTALTTATRTVQFDDESFASNNVMVVTGPATAKLKVLSDNTAASTIDASAITLASGSAALLEYQGGTKADTITGGIQSETILHSIGADVIDGGGGAGVDTLSIADSTVTPTGSANVSLGAVINLGSTAVNSVSVYAAVAAYTAGAANVGTGSLSYNYAQNLTTNLAEAQSLSGIENVTGGDGKDYIVGTSGNNTIDGLGGQDYIDGGDGDDTITVANTAAAGTDKMHGGLGNDLINVTATTTFSTTDADITGIETVTVSGTGNQNIILTGQSEAFTINGNAGNNAITGGSGADTINGLGGADTITTGSGIDTIDVGAAGDVDTLVSAATTSAGYFNVSNLAVAEDKIDFNAAILSDDTNKTIINGKEGGGSADIASIGTAETFDLITAAMTSNIIDEFLAGTKTEAQLEAAALVSMGDGGTTTATQTAIGGLDTALANGSKIIVATVDNEDTAFWYVVQTSGGTGGANVLAADEITLLGIVQGDVMNTTEANAVVI